MSEQTEMKMVAGGLVFSQVFLLVAWLLGRKEA